LQTSLARLLAFDRRTRESHGIQGLVAGVDEAGCAPLAGPVVAAAVIFLRRPNAPELNDSKQLSSKIREKIYPEICRHSMIGIGVASEAEIDTVNLYYARRLAMVRALLSLTRTPDFIFVDGNMRLPVPVPHKTIVAGDAKSACIAAASVIAKVYRDNWMKHLDSLYPAYDFKTHKGYPTPQHIQNLEANGPSPVHRKSFTRVRDLLEKVFV
jgi:ribonuclease HII